MIIGLPKEIKDNEYRVGLTPAGVRALTDAGHTVVVEKNAGAGSGFEDPLYQRAGAKIVAPLVEAGRCGGKRCKRRGEQGACADAGLQQRAAGRVYQGIRLIHARHSSGAAGLRQKP